MHSKTAHGEQKETFLMVDKSPAEEIAQPEEPTAIFLVDNIKFENVSFNYKCVTRQIKIFYP